VGGARSPADLEALAADVKAVGGAIEVLQTDVTSHAQLQRLGDVAVQKFGGVDAWVNNAGGFVPDVASNTDMIDIAENTLEEMLRLNVTAQILGAQVAARAMRAGRGGSIVFISSIGGLYATPGGEGIYGACKAALNSLTQTMAVELGRYKIRVNAIAPAVILTPMTQPWFPTEEARQKRSGLYPLGRLGKPEDVSSAVVYLSSDEAAWVSGAVLLVSGGAVYTSDPYRYLMKLQGNEV
jgi:NAD(P)-dependent dehydrogenase (short-subunit alcohol dehydrogenase family)